MGYKAFYEATVSSSRQKVFATLMDFGGLDKLLPKEAIESVSCTGSGVGAVRDIRLGEGSGFPGQVVERLDAAYDERVFAYSILGVPSIPMEDYVSVVELADTADGGCHVKWGSNWVPTGDLSEAELKPRLEGLYAAIVAKL